MDFLRLRSLLSFNLYSYLQSKCGITRKFIPGSTESEHTHKRRRVTSRDESEKRITITANRWCCCCDNKNKKPMKLKSHIVKMCRGATTQQPSAKFIKFDEISLSLLLRRPLFLVRFDLILFCICSGFIGFIDKKEKWFLNWEKKPEHTQKHMRARARKKPIYHGRPLSKCF